MKYLLLIEKLSKATKMLAECKTFDGAREIHDIAEAARQWAIIHNLGIEASNNASELKFRAARKMGSFLKGTYLNTGGRPTKTGTGGSTGFPTLSELNISKNQSSRLQQIASIPDKQFNNFVNEKRNNKEEMTQTALLKISKDGHIRQVMGSSEDVEFYTPKHIIEIVEIFLGTIDLDPCSESTSKNGVPAKKRYTKQQDGLSQVWAGSVYMNPPYGAGIENWINKLVESHTSGTVKEAIVLVPARIDTVWFQPLYDFLICAIKGRLTFSNSNNAAPFPCVLVYLGKRKSAFIKEFSSLGTVLMKA